MWCVTGERNLSAPEVRAPVMVFLVVFGSSCNERECAHMYMHLYTHTHTRPPFIQSRAGCDVKKMGPFKVTVKQCFQARLDLGTQALSSDWQRPPGIKYF